MGGNKSLHHFIANFNIKISCESQYGILIYLRNICQMLLFIACKVVLILPSCWALDLISTFICKFSRLLVMLQYPSPGSFACSCFINSRNQAIPMQAWITRDSKVWWIPDNGEKKYKKTKNPSQSFSFV